MADQQNQKDQQNQQGRQNQQRAGQDQGSADSNAALGRSEDLLPAGANDSSDDGRFEVAEEVNLDQQSDSTRRVGQASRGAATEAMADALKPDPAKQDAPKQDAPQRGA